MGNACGRLDGKLGSKYTNCYIEGNGGELDPPPTRTVCMVVSFDYKGYKCYERAGCCELTAIKDGRRFAMLAKDSGVDTREYYDSNDYPTNLGFPGKKTILGAWRKLGHELGPNDCFVFFYAGHGSQMTDDNGDEQDGLDEVMCFVTPDGYRDFVRDDEVSEILLNHFKPTTKVLFVTDCCHCATICDLQRPALKNRPILHLSAVKDEQTATDIGDGGAFTSSLLEVVEDCFRDDDTRQSVVDVFNNVYGKYNQNKGWSDQDFEFEQTYDYDPDTFPWPLQPPKGWTVKTALDKQKSAIQRLHDERVRLQGSQYHFGDITQTAFAVLQGGYTQGDPNQRGVAYANRGGVVDPSLVLSSYSLRPQTADIVTVPTISSVSTLPAQPQLVTVA